MLCQETDKADKTTLPSGVSSVLSVHAMAFARKLQVLRPTLVKGVHTQIWVRERPCRLRSESDRIAAHSGVTPEAEAEAGGCPFIARWHAPDGRIDARLRTQGHDSRSRHCRLRRLGVGRSLRFAFLLGFRCPDYP